LLIDSGNSANHAKLFKDQLASHQIYGDLLALTHWHWDHVFGLSEMAIPSIANQKTANQLNELQQYSWGDTALEERLEAGIDIPCCPEAIKLDLGNERDITIPNPTLLFEEQVQLSPGGINCVIEHIDSDHSIDANLIY